MLVEYRNAFVPDDQYRTLLEELLAKGEKKSPLNKPERPCTYSLPGGAVMRYDLRNGFPWLTLRKMPEKAWRALVVELLWFLSGSTNINDLREQGVHLWDFADDDTLRQKYGRAEGDLGPIYGEQWRRFKGPESKVIDQISRLIEGIKNDPDSKAHYVSAWHPSELMEQDGTPRTRPVNCHTAFQVSHSDGNLDLYLNQRSGDAPIGIPFNFASYSLLLMMIAQVTGMRARYFVHMVNDFHYYDNQKTFTEKLVLREPLIFPRVYVNPEVTDIFGFRPEDFSMEGYASHPYMKIPVTA